MASLTHVCMWSDKGWKRISAEQAAKLHPGGTVSARSGLFMCELCGQYVTLTDGDIRTRYFKHSAFEKSKDCPERTFGPDYAVSYNAQDYELPIRINDVSTLSFRFEVGLIRVPENLLTEDLRVEIRPKGDSGISYIFAKERMNVQGVTYLPIGDIPYEKYTLKLQNGEDELYKFWPKEIEGIDSDGTLFDKQSGKKLTQDADVEIGKEYYLLKSGYDIEGKSYQSIRIHKVVQKQAHWKRWSLYIVSAVAMDEEAARFFLDFHYRLTESPISMQPVWPLLVEGNYIIKHNQVSTRFLVKGDALDIKAFPFGFVQNLNRGGPSGKLYEVQCAGRQQLISAGRVRALQYTYFWKEALNEEGACPEFSVTDLKGDNVVSGESNLLPHKKSLLFESAYDGQLVIFNQNKIIEKRKISAGEIAELNGLTFGLNIRFIIGLDVVWQIKFKKTHAATESDEIEVYKKITEVTGPLIPVPHSLRNILGEMKEYPLLCQWIRKCLLNGAICEQSYRRLQAFYLKINTKR